MLAPLVLLLALSNNINLRRAAGRLPAGGGRGV